MSVVDFLASRLQLNPQVLNDVPAARHVHAALESVVKQLEQQQQLVVAALQSASAGQPGADTLAHSHERLVLLPQRQLDELTSRVRQLEASNYEAAVEAAAHGNTSKLQALSTSASLSQGNHVVPLLQVCGFF